MSQWVRSAQGGLKAAALEASPPRTTVIRLSNLPKTALPSDVRRMLRTNQLENIARVSLEYNRFRPTGVGFVTLTTPDSMENNLRLLQKSTLTSLPLKASPVRGSAVQVVGRTRGIQGRQNAADRGIITGHGPDGGVASNGRNVVVWGLPGRLEPDTFKQYLTKFGLSGSKGGEAVSKLDPLPVKTSLTSRQLDILRRAGSR